MVLYVLLYFVLNLIIQGLIQDS